MENETEPGAAATVEADLASGENGTESKGSPHVENAERSKDEQEVWRDGGWRTAPFIFGAGACDFLASMGILVNMLSYLRTKLHLTLAEGATTMMNFMGMCSYTPLIGAFVADAYIGRRKTILISTVIYLGGLFLLVAETIVPNMKQRECKTKHCEYPIEPYVGYLYLAFVFIAIGSGGIRPNAASFGADQFDQRIPAERRQLYGFFNWYYFVIVLAILFSSTLLVYIQDSKGWGWGFGIPAMAMVVSAVVFYAGTPLYRQMVPAGSPFTHVAQVVVAAFRKRHIAVPEDPKALYQGKIAEDGISLRHTMQFRFLDKAAVLTDADFNEQLGGVDPWRVCRISQVEELKSLLRMTPVWATGVPVFVAWSQQGTVWVQQAFFMDRHMGSHFEIPAGSMSVFPVLTMLIFLPLYVKFVIPLARRVTGSSRGITFLQRIGAGVVMSALAMLVAGFVEVKRRNYHQQPPLTCFWLVPQFCLVGLAEAFVSIGYLEFFYDQSPPSMRSMASGVVWAIIGTGNYISSFMVTTIQKLTSRKSSHGWLSTNPNDGHYEYFFWMLAGILAMDFVLHLVVAWSYQYTKPDYDDEDDKLPIGLI